MATVAHGFTPPAGRDERWLAEWLSLELSATIAGSKPATLLSFNNTKCCPLLALWQKYGSEVMAGSIVDAFVLTQSPEKVTILFYRPDILDQWLAAENHREFLRGQGYPVDRGLEACLELLRSRFSNSCPHEVGVFLGIPLEDVLGFMGLSCEPCTYRQGWQVYGDPQRSLAVMKQYADDRCRMARLIEEGLAPRQLLCGCLPECAQAPDECGCPICALPGETHILSAEAPAPLPELTA